MQLPFFPTLFSFLVSADFSVLFLALSATSDSRLQLRVHPSSSLPRRPLVEGGS